jgi:hypothetical protein
MQMIVRLVILVICSSTPTACRADDSPRAIIEAAIKAHGGEQKLTSTLTGTLLAKAMFSMSPELQATITWEETFELPRRYRRSIKGEAMGRKFSMEYAITDGNGWIRQDGGAPTDHKGEKQPLSSSWNAILALLPLCLEEGVELKTAGKQKVDGKDAIGVRVSGGQWGEAVLFFDMNSRLLLKSKKKMDHPLTQQEVDGEVFFGDYKQIAGIQYPHRLISHVDGKKVIDMEITRIEFLKKLDDRLFLKP